MAMKSIRSEHEGPDSEGKRRAPFHVTGFDALVGLRYAHRWLLSKVMWFSGRRATLPTAIL